jgi:L-amino acid N-acyltransferase YncA
MIDTLEIKRFQDVPLSDNFFNSLKEDYKEFPNWYKRKERENVYVQRTDDKLTGFMYLKSEQGKVADVIPPMKAATRIKIGTLKVEAHGTRLGERLIKKAFDRAIVDGVNEIYITIFPKHKALINMLAGFGFILYGEKRTGDGTENVYVKYLLHDKLVGNLRKDYPLINTTNVNFYLLGIYPEWHTQLFPDSILKTESYDLLSDISFTNSVSKNYVSWMRGLNDLRQGDILLIYRTKEGERSAEYSSVVTSVCSVEDVRTKASFSNIEEYIAYAEPFSVFDKPNLNKWWRNENLTVIKMLYNAALTKRVIRKTLMETVGLSRNAYAGFMKLTRNQFLQIIDLGGVNDRLIVR